MGTEEPSRQDLINKLNRVLQLLEGEGEAAPGILARVSALERVIYGRDSVGGIAQQVVALTKLKSWLIATMSAGAGAVLAIGVQYIVKHI
jgi:hypothetical protein